MGKDKGFRTMQELVAAIAAAERALEKGEAGSSDLEQACKDVRELYERLIVLRHKAREASVPKERTSANTVRPSPAPAPDVVKEPAGEAIRLDTRPPDVSPRQTSLIEAIEASEDVPARPTAAKEEIQRPAREEKPKPAAIQKEAPKTHSLGDKLSKASIPSLGKAISLSHKFWFVSELYNGDRISYEKSIEYLDKLTDRSQAEVFVRTEVIGKLKKPADPEALNTFMDLIEKRFS